MDNPYQAPNSDLGKEAPKPKSKKGWKIYFWVMASLHLLAIVTTFVAPEDEYSSLDQLVNYVVYPIIILGVFGFAYGKSIFASGFWKIWILVTLATDARSFSYLFETDFIDAAGMGLYLSIALIVALATIMIALQYFCLYLYAFRSPEIWREPQ